MFKSVPYKLLVLANLFINKVCLCHRGIVHYYIKKSKVLIGLVQRGHSTISHWKATCSHHDIAEFFFYLALNNNRPITHSLSPFDIKLEKNVFNPWFKDHFQLSAYILPGTRFSISHAWLADFVFLDFWCFNANFSNISAISWRPVLVVEKAGVPGENHQPWESNW